MRLDQKLKKSWVSKQDKTQKSIKSESNILDETYWDLAETRSHKVLQSLIIVLYKYQFGLFWTLLDPFCTF